MHLGWGRFFKSWLVETVWIQSCTFLFTLGRDWIRSQSAGSVYRFVFEVLTHKPARLDSLKRLFTGESCRVEREPSRKLRHCNPYFPVLIFALPSMFQVLYQTDIYRGVLVRNSLTPLSKVDKKSIWGESISDSRRTLTRSQLYLSLHRYKINLEYSVSQETRLRVTEGESSSLSVVKFQISNNPSGTLQQHQM